MRKRLFVEPQFSRHPSRGRRNGISNGADEFSPKKFSLLHGREFFGPSRACFPENFEN